jgi:hypothetical protein
VFAILTNQLSQGRKSYVVRWEVAGKRHRETFTTKALAEGHRSKLVTAQREGTPFDEESGLPLPMAERLKARSWLNTPWRMQT